MGFPKADWAHALISCISQLCLPFCVDRGLWIMLLSSWSWYSEYITDTFIKIGITLVRKINAKPNRNRFTPSACSSGDNSDNLIGGKRDHKFHALCQKLLSLENPFEFIWNLKYSFKKFSCLKIYLQHGRHRVVQFPCIQPYRMMNLNSQTWHHSSGSKFEIDFQTG